MRLFPKFPDNMGFWQKWNVVCMMFAGSCLLAASMLRDFPEVAESAEQLMWIGGAGMAFGIVMHLLTTRKNK
jgi:hypothetical protein